MTVLMNMNKNAMEQIDHPKRLMPIEPTTGIAGARVIMDLLRMAAEKLQKPKPDVPGALALINQTQRHLDQLRSENLELNQQLLKAERENFELQKTQQQNEAWKKETEGIELVQVPGGATVYRHRTTNFLYCPSCYAEKKLIPIQAFGSASPQCKRCSAYYQIEKRPRQAAQGLSEIPY